MTANHQSRTTHSLSNARRQIRKSNDVCMAIGVGKPTTRRGTAVVPRTRIKIQFQTEESASQLTIRREVLGWLIAARSGHGHFAAYHQRVPHEEEEGWRCPCGKYRAPLHPFGCANARAHRALLWSEKTKRALSTEEILSNLERAAKWAPETRLHNRRSRVREQSSDRYFRSVNKSGSGIDEGADAVKGLQRSLSQFLAACDSCITPCINNVQQIQRPPKVCMDRTLEATALNMAPTRVELADNKFLSLPPFNFSSVLLYMSVR